MHLLKEFNKKTTKVFITLKRPNGKIEIIETKFENLTNNQFKQIQKNTKKANNSDVLSFEKVVTYKIIKLSKEDIQEQKDMQEYNDILLNRGRINKMSQMGE